MVTRMPLTLEEWKRETRLVQQNFSDMLGDRTWDEFDLTDDNGQDFLFAKIAFSLFSLQACVLFIVIIYYHIYHHSTIDAVVTLAGW